MKTINATRIMTEKQKDRLYQLSGKFGKEGKELEECQILDRLYYVYIEVLKYNQSLEV